MPKNDQKKKQRIIVAKLLEGNTRCWYCGIAFSDDTLPTVDHVYPEVYGGDLSDGNTVLACRSCNCAKCHRDLEWMREHFVHGQTKLPKMQALYLESLGIDLTWYYEPIKAFRFYGETKNGGAS